MHGSSKILFPSLSFVFPLKGKQWWVLLKTSFSSYLKINKGKFKSEKKKKKWKALQFNI